MQLLPNKHRFANLPSPPAVPILAVPVYFTNGIGVCFCVSQGLSRLFSLHRSPLSVLVQVQLAALVGAYLRARPPASAWILPAVGDVVLRLPPHDVVTVPLGLRLGPTSQS